MKIKAKLALLCAANAFVLPGAFADETSNVSVYGAIDVMLRHSTNEMMSTGALGSQAALGSQTRLDSGFFQGSRFGLKGTEQLGDGTAAVFQLESGFSPTTGAFGQQKQLFGRQAFAGLRHGSWGELDVGRQYGVAYDVLGNYDPLGFGSVDENSWQNLLTGERFDNTLKYTNSWGGLAAELQYSLGGQTGGGSKGTTAGFGLNYTAKPYAMGVTMQQSKDSGSRKSTVAGLGASAGFGSVTGFANYFRSKIDAGFTIAADASGMPLANTGLFNNSNNKLQRTDSVGTVGLVYQPTQAMGYTLGYMTDSVKNENSNGDAGKISTFYAVADYSFSKRTDVYLSVDYTKVSGGEIAGKATNSLLETAGDPLSATNRTGLGLGMRTKF